MMNERFTNPFPGLRPFESNEDHLFFGRDGQSDELLRRLRRSRFLAVLGTSGSGKSSLVRAGMLPSLFGGLMTQAGSDWRVALFRPGQDPIGHLASALASSQVLGSDGDDAALQKTIIEATLRRSALGLVEATRQARMVEIDARVPPRSDRSALWRLARYHISFISEDGERVFSDFRKLYRDENADAVNRILTQMRTEITRQALRISDNEIMKTVIKNGRYKDKTLKQVLDNPTNEDLLAMMAEMLQYPATYYGKDMKLFRTFAAWVLDEPK